MASKAASAATKYGKLWGRGYETFKNRRILSVSGTADHATTYLQGLVTSDLFSEPRAPREEVEDAVIAARERGGEASDASEVEEEVPVRFTSKMRSTCFLDHRGRILTDAILWKRVIENNESSDTSKATTEYFIDVPSDTADMLMDHLKVHTLRRSKIKLADKSDDISVHGVYGTLNAEGAPPGYMAAMDPRHPSMGMRILSVGPEAMGNNADHDGESANDDDISNESEANEAPTTNWTKRTNYFSKLMNNFFPHAPGTYSVLRKLSGIAEGSELTSRTALECNQEFLNAVSFSKGCYLGQELTARSQFTGVVRKRILPVMIVETEMEVPRPWIMASMIQELGEKDGMEKIFGLTNEESADGAGSLISMMMGSVASSDEGGNPQDDNDGSTVESEEAKQRQIELQKLREAGERLQNEISALAIPGASIVDKKDGKTIGKVISAPAPGTTVLLAQMRLDRLGLLGNAEKWSRTNKILIGEGTKEYRYLPYLPLWWPEIDTETGKEKLADEKNDDDELDEL
ncbi:hypothetical protein HJC23_012840 [Cyclotella cryptica]|uniref:Aminomethyltransferase folate-binding domain-containing protein n=1 Tax=Cyclotella cryptica TaxID=29204 RepID=A0ABD3Q1M1_9STRA|eukprot:CCRYP_009408-RA/>CCRYP_009408-RA protein AED:0.04 eAED:0.02 QI:0/0/0/1/1/1/2/0/518